MHLLPHIPVVNQNTFAMTLVSVAPNVLSDIAMQAPMTLYTGKHKMAEWYISNFKGTLLCGSLDILVNRLTLHKGTCMSNLLNHQSNQTTIKIHKHKAGTSEIPEE